MVVNSLKKTDYGRVCPLNKILFYTKLWGFFHVFLMWLSKGVKFGKMEYKLKEWTVKNVP